ncbi:hypothetical protein N2152v2_005971 [Parachlorella kessleri]
MANGARPRGLRVAVEGCCHGELDKIYEALNYLEQREGTKIDLLICCGDFQAVRNYDDLECMACPAKYRELQTFYKYYSGQKKAPCPTLFIGGNHEAANYLWELYLGGWAAPNIYFLGYAGVINFGGVRIGGLSGIYKDQHYQLGHFERPPYNAGSMRSAYHVRALDVHRLLRIARPLDVFLSHDWPQGIARHGDLGRLLQRKSFLRREIEDNSLGSPPATELLTALRPSYWFSAHLHTKYAALYQHQARGSGPAQATRFLALDKCLPGRNFLQVVEFPEADGPLEFSYDEEWLAILKATHSLVNLQRRPWPVPAQAPPVTQAQLEDIRQRLQQQGGPRVPDNFVPTAPAYDPANPRMQRGSMPTELPRNPQTVALLDLLGLSYNLDRGGQQADAAVPAAEVANPEEIDLHGEDDDVPDDDDDSGEPAAQNIHAALAAVMQQKEQNPEEIALDDEDS